MRKAFLLGETVFKREKGLLNELSYYVVESLGSTYPEMEKNIEQVINYSLSIPTNIGRYLKQIALHRSLLSYGCHHRQNITNSLI